MEQSFGVPVGALLTQSCSLRSVTLAPTYRRALFSSLQSVTNALLYGQLVPTPTAYTCSQ